MHPVLLSIGKVTISSFGLFIVLGAAVSIYIAWKISRFYDLDEEKVVDISLLSFFGGILGARAYEVLLNPTTYDNLEKIVFLNLYPGLSIWGGLIGGFLTLALLARSYKLVFWQLADIAGVGLAIALSIGDIGCFLGGCAYGFISNLPFATKVVGVIGNRLPISLFEAGIFLLVFGILWKRILRFHLHGQIISFFLIFFGLVKIAFERFRSDKPTSWQFTGEANALFVLLLGIIVFYYRGKRSIYKDAKNLALLLVEQKRRKNLVQILKKNWYNIKVGWLVRLQLLQKYFSVTIPAQVKNLKRRLNVKSTPTDLR